MQGIQVVLCVLFAAALFVTIVWPAFKNQSGDQKPDEAEELCVNCNYDARGLLHCPECNAETRAGRRARFARLREEWPREQIAPRVPAASETPVVILTTDDGMAARLICDHLQARGIWAQAAQSNATYGAVYQAARTSFRVTVWSDDEERARLILQRLWPAENRGWFLN